MEKLTLQQPTLEELAAFAEQLNANGEVTVAKRQAWDLVTAYDVMHGMLNSGASIDEKAIKELQGIITDNTPHISRSQKGRFSYSSEKTIVNIPWELKPFSDGNQIDSRMQALTGKLGGYIKFKPEDPKQTYSVIDHAARIMIDLVDIHPFADGNGRTSRLLADAVLQAGGLYPMPHWVNPRIEDRNEGRMDFFSMVERARRGYYPSILKFMVQQQRHALESELTAIEINPIILSDARTAEYWDDRIGAYDMLTGYQANLNSVIQHNPPIPLPAKTGTT